MMAASSTVVGVFTVVSVTSSGGDYFDYRGHTGIEPKRVSELRTGVQPPMNSNVRTSAPYPRGRL
jgi:hypothetical protein